MTRLSRFLHLERSRDGRAKPEEPSQLQNGQRFEAVEAPGEALHSVVPEAHLERFKPGDAPLLLEGEPTDEAAQYFPRCARCEAENGRFVPRCIVCGADLNAPEQHEYNARHLKERQAQAVQEREAIHKHLQEELEARRRDADRQVEGLMAQLRDSERGGARWRTFSESRSVGLGLLRLIPHPLGRLAVLAGCILPPVLLVSLGSGGVKLSGVVLGVVLFVLFVPSSRPSEERNRWRW